MQPNPFFMTLLSFFIVPFLLGGNPIFVSIPKTYFSFACLNCINLAFPATVFQVANTICPILSLIPKKNKLSGLFLLKNS